MMQHTEAGYSNYYYYYYYGDSEDEKMILPSGWKKCESRW